MYATPCLSFPRLSGGWRMFFSPSGPKSRYSHRLFHEANINSVCRLLFLKLDRIGLVVKWYHQKCLHLLSLSHFAWDTQLKPQGKNNKSPHYSGPKGAQRVFVHYALHPLFPENITGETLHGAGRPLQWWETLMKLSFAGDIVVRHTSTRLYWQTDRNTGWRTEEQKQAKVWLTLAAIYVNEGQFEKINKIFVSLIQNFGIWDQVIENFLHKTEEYIRSMVAAQRTIKLSGWQQKLLLQLV